MPTLRSIPALFFLSLFLASSIWALDPSRLISQYAHSSWLVRDGAVTGNPRVFAQTGDGYIWIGTTTGLFRFDGIRFLPWSPKEEQLPSPRINSLLGANDGSLWIGTAVGLSHWKENHLTNLAVQGIVPAIIQARNGTIWFVLDDPTATIGRLCEVSSTTVQCHGKEEGIPEFDYTPVAEDSQGDFWLGADHVLVRWQPGSNRVSGANASRPDVLNHGASSIVATPEGSLWASSDRGGLQRRTGEVWKPFLAPGWDGSERGDGKLLLDRENALWVPTSHHGVYRIYDGKVDHYGTAEGLSGDSVMRSFEDREGNVWIATLKGVDCFRNLRVASFSTHEGVGSEEVDTVLALHDGSVILGGPGMLDVLRGGRFSALAEGKDVSKAQVASLFEDKKGHLWVGLGDALSIYEHGRFRRINGLHGGPTGMIVGITEDIDGNIWAEARGQPRKLLRIRDFKVQQEFPAPQMPAARRLAPDPAGGIWLGLINGDLARYQRGQLDAFHFQHKPDSLVQQVILNSDGAVLGATGFGLIGWREGKQSTLTVRNGLPCNGIFGTVLDDRGNLWLYAECGLIEIAGGDVERWWRNPEVMVQPRIFGLLDGAQPGWAPFVSAAKSADGRLWFSNGSSVQMIDPSHLEENSLPPPVSVEGVVADRRTYSVHDGLLLPPLTRDLEIDYTALSFVAPQKVGFRYKLEGRDVSWQEPGTRRQAFYTDLRPGKYRFRVIAYNNDGVWNEEGATMDFGVAPAWFQTRWFLILCISSGLVIVWALFRLRIRQIRSSLSARFSERLAERTRIARELHDTLLQSLHGLMFQFQAARNMLPRSPDHAMQTLDEAIAGTREAIAESRDAIHDLRSQPVVEGDLAKLLDAVGLELTSTGRANGTSPTFRMIVEGEPQELSPALQGEVYMIARELMRNAFRHAGASQIEAEIRYDKNQIRIRIRDDGKGIAAQVLEVRRPGHWGLPGVRERAERIGAKLRIWSQAGAGTEVELTVPAAVAYKDTANESRFRLFR